MSIFFTSLNSGSNGNCYYIGNKNEAVLVDVGISCKEVEKRLKRLALSIHKIKAIFISHEHSDHIRGLQVLSGKYHIPVYITTPTLKNSTLKLNEPLLRSFNPDEEIMVGSLKVVPFSKLHDAADPYSFIVEGNGITVGVFTDIGSACENVIRYFKKCHAIFLESNFDEKMLDEGGYPYYLKKRIRSDKGHLSNDQALELFLKHRPAHMSRVILSHLSKANNSPEIVHDLFIKHANNVNIVVASRYEETEIFELHTDDLNNVADHSLGGSADHGVQMTLF